jgi:tRNA threonylcarbamoyladenosine biosynthesis protein TsaB
MPERGRAAADPGAVLLAWDTSTIDGSIVLVRAGEVIAETRFKTVKGHASWLMPLVSLTLEGLRMNPSDVGAVAAGIGPGAYTGVKVGVTTAKALAIGLDVPMVALPTLDLFAANALGCGGPVLASMDARQGMVYLAGYATAECLPERVTDYKCLYPEEAGGLAGLLGPGRLTVIGYAPAELLSSISDAGIDAVKVEVPAPGFPNGKQIARVATAMLQDGRAVDAVAVAPIYLKRPV